MTTPASGTISVSQVSVEIGRAETATTSLGETAVRNLAGVASGTISMSNLHGKTGGGAGGTLSASGVNDSRIYDSATSGGTAFARPSVTVTGGVTPYTFLWSFTSNPDACALADSTLQTCEVTKSYSAGADGEANATLQCVITDAASTAITVTGVTASMLWASGM